MVKKINKEIRRLLLEITLVTIFTIVTLPLFDYIGNSSLAQVANHYSNAEEDSIVVTNEKKHIYSNTFEESIRERRYVMLTSYEKLESEYSIYLTLNLDDDYKDIMVLTGSIELTPLSDLLIESSDKLYFKLSTGVIDPKQTLEYNYYIWSKDVDSTKNIELEFVVL